MTTPTPGRSRRHCPAPRYGQKSHILVRLDPILAPHYRVVRFDMRGMGQSSVPAPGYPWSIDNFARDLLNLLERLELSRVHLIGETVGALSP